ncbi:response regulator [Microseira wollei]|uniref:Two-component response regulator n=1 Tax=Microseira wollei NIES-4236 TaxID=2530354 RepID=A0AAV3WIY9_9CYAN|nr:response regulator [Microseira wollei]GET39759.1 two-component response regulator [Microseira wollei NIES-4236]
MSAKRILIVDDEYDIRAVAELALKTVAGWQVLTAASGREGLDQAIAQQPDAILLDVMMPEMDGIATWQALQANPATESIPVILMTAKAQAADQRRFASLGVAGIITKPFKAMQLSAQVVAVLGWQP